MNKNDELVRTVAEAAIMAALAFVLDLLQGVIFDAIPFFANGGSVGIAMLPIIILAVRRGPVVGFLAGLVTGILQMLGGVYAISSDWYKVMFQILEIWGGPLAYSILYNGVYMLPSTILCLACVIVIYLRRSDFFFANKKVQKSEVKA